MKRIFTLAIAAAFVLGTVCSANAIDVKVKGQWDFAFGWAENVARGAQGFNDTSKGGKRNDDPFDSMQRIRTQIDFIASENLSATMMFEWGDTFWGRTDKAGYAGSGRGATGALDADGVGIEVKRAYLDWMVPGMDWSFRMGVQGLALPMATGYNNPVFNADVAAILTSYKINDMFSVAAFWARPFDQYENDSTVLGGGRGNVKDEMDMFGLMMPVTLNGFKITPWMVYSQIGYGIAGDHGVAKRILQPYVGSSLRADHDTEAWWAGTAFEMTLFNPLKFSMDVMYGDMHGGKGRNYGTRGWFIDAALDYKMSWGTPGIFGWWSSGDSANDVRDGKFGSIPVLDPDGGYNPTTFGYDGGIGITRDQAMSISGAGLWSVGLQIKDMSFVENLSHTIRVMYSQGTNDHKILSREMNLNMSTLANGRMYLTDKDSAIEVNFDHKYQIYENLAAYLELGYIHLDLDKAWKNSYRGGNDTNDAWKAQVSFQYKF